MAATDLTEELASYIKEFWSLPEIKEIFNNRSDHGVQVDTAAP